MAAPGFSRSSLLVVLFLVAAAGTAGVTWWQQRADSNRSPATPEAVAPNDPLETGFRPLPDPPPGSVPAAPDRPFASEAGAAPPPATPPDPQRFQELAAQFEKLDRTVWNQEVLAQQYEDAFVDLWDALRNTSDPVEVLTRFPFETLVVQGRGTPVPHEDGITITPLDGITRALSPEDWRKWLVDLREQGMQLVQSEWHHAAFDLDDDGLAHSTVSVTLHLHDENGRGRVIVKGDLRVDWQRRDDPQALPRAGRITAQNMRLLERTGTPAFTQVLEADPKQTGAAAGMPMLVILHDLNGDGLTDILLPGCNRLYQNRGDMQWNALPLLAHSPGYLRAGVVADFTGDGNADLLAAFEGDPLLFVGAGDGTFPTAPLRVPMPEPLRLVSVITAGDVDGDGDLDAWIAQYRPPYVGGQMPTPYYDANDGLPAFLMRNDGNGRFADITASAGLEAKRFRRTYGSSFVDLDGDHDLDLLVTSDFAGIDVYANDGRGHFTDVTDSWIDEPHNFGMSHTFADFDGDAALDFMVIGMSSTTARRLEHMGLGREEFEEHQRMRMPMGYGNRMYLSRGAGRYQVAPFNDQVARSGWSWGSTAFDLENDGDRDVYVANGHISKKSAKDYCTIFWCHDIYTGDSKPDPSLDAFFGSLHQAFDTISWNGFEHNALFLNESGNSFQQVGFLMDVAFEFDSRSVLSGDLDDDGRVDLVLTELRRPEGPVLHVLRNTWEPAGHWIAVRLRDGGPGKSPLGARVRVVAGGREQVAAVVAGDSFYAQHDSVVHFGLGGARTVEFVEILWPDGTRQRLESPEIDHTHTVHGADAG